MFLLCSLTEASSDNEVKKAKLWYSSPELDNKDSIQEWSTLLTKSDSLSYDEIRSKVIKGASAWCLFYCQCFVLNSYKSIIEVHEMHGRMHPNYGFITVMLCVAIPMQWSIP